METRYLINKHDGYKHIWDQYLAEREDMLSPDEYARYKAQNASNDAVAQEVKENQPQSAADASEGTDKQDLVAQYIAKFGKKPFHGWSDEVLAEKLAAE